MSTAILLYTNIIFLLILANKTLIHRLVFTCKKLAALQHCFDMLQAVIKTTKQTFTYVDLKTMKNVKESARK